MTQRGVPAELTAELLDCATVLRQRMRAAWIPEPEIVKGLVHPPILRTIPRVFEPADGASVRGRIITVIGSQIVIDSDRGDTVALDARAMSGWQVSSIGAEQGTSGQISLAVV